MSLLLLLVTPASGGGSGDGSVSVNGSGEIIVGPDGTWCTNCACTLVAPIRECSDGAAFTIPESGLPAYNVCLATDNTIYYWWSNLYEACFYWDCSEKAAGEENSFLLDEELDPDCTDPICDADDDGNPDPPTTPPTIPPSDVDCCGNDHPGGTMYQVVIAGVNPCPCVGGAGDTFIAHFNPNLTFRFACNGSVSRTIRANVTAYDPTCTAFGTTPSAGAITINFNSLSLGQWYVTIDLGGRTLFGSTGFGDCTGGVGANFQVDCTGAPLGWGGGTVTVTEVPLLP